MEHAQEQPTSGEQHDGRDHRCHDHPPPHSPLRHRIEVLGLLEERHQGELGTHADQQEQKQLDHEFSIDNREIIHCEARFRYRVAVTTPIRDRAVSFAKRDCFLAC